MTDPQIKVAIQNAHESFLSPNGDGVVTRKDFYWWTMTFMGGSDITFQDEEGRYLTPQGGPITAKEVLKGEVGKGGRFSLVEGFSFAPQMNVTLLPRRVITFDCNDGSRMAVVDVPDDSGQVVVANRLSCYIDESTQFYLRTPVSVGAKAIIMAGPYDTDTPEAKTTVRFINMITSGWLHPVDVG